MDENCTHRHLERFAREISGLTMGFTNLLQIPHAFVSHRMLGVTRMLSSLNHSG